MGGVILAVIEGLNIALVRMFSSMGPPVDEPITMGAAGDGKASQAVAAEQPWWAKLISPPPPPPDVDFSDPKEVHAAAVCSQRCRAPGSNAAGLQRPFARGASQCRSVVVLRVPPRSVSTDGGCGACRCNRRRASGRAPAARPTHRWSRAWMRPKFCCSCAPTATRRLPSASGERRSSCAARCKNSSSELVSDAALLLQQRSCPPVRACIAVAATLLSSSARGPVFPASLCTMYTF